MWHVHRLRTFAAGPVGENPFEAVLEVLKFFLGQHRLVVDQVALFIELRNFV
jgi:hypothetical protein